LIANEIVDEAKRKKKEELLFKVDFERRMTQSIGTTWISLWKKWDFMTSGGCGCLNV
jgi:hypothetical protein